MSKPLLPNSFVNFQDGQLPRGPVPSGIFVFIGVGNGAATDGAITAVNTPNDIQRLFGVGPLAQDLVTFFLSGGGFCYAIKLASTTAGAAGTVTVGQFTGLTAGGSLLGAWDVRGRIVVGGTLGVAQIIYSLDGGSTWGPAQVLMAGANDVVAYGSFKPGLQVTPTAMTYAVDPNALDAASSQEFSFKVTAPTALTAAVIAAMDTAIQDQALFFNAFHLSGLPSDVLTTAAAYITFAGTLATKLQDASDTWFKYLYIAHAIPLQTSGAAAATFMRAVRAGFANNRVQIFSMPARVKSLGGQFIMATSAVGAARRSTLEPQNDLGIVSAGQLQSIVGYASGWSISDVIALDQIKNSVTIRQIFGAAGFYFTNGWMSDPSSDYAKDNLRMVADLCATDVRTAGIYFIKMDVDPLDPSASAETLLNVCRAPLAVRVKRKQMSRAQLSIQPGQDVLSTETLVVTVSIIPMASASWIQFNVGFQSPFTGK